DVDARDRRAQPCEQDAVFAFAAPEIEDRSTLQIAQQPAGVLLRKQAARRAVAPHDALAELGDLRPFRCPLVEELSFLPPAILRRPPPHSCPSAAMTGAARTEHSNGDRRLQGRVFTAPRAAQTRSAARQDCW